MTDRLEHAGALNGTGAAAIVAAAVPSRRSMGELEAEPGMIDAVKSAVETTTDSYALIARRFGVAPGSLNRYARDREWQRPAGSHLARVSRPGPRALAGSIEEAGAVVVRLLRGVDRQICKVETRLRKKGAEVDEKDARILGHLAKTLQTLMALGRDDGAAAKEPVDREELDADLARRIKRWAEGGEGSG